MHSAISGENLQEQRRGIQIVQEAERLHRKYREQMNFLESYTPLAKVRPITVHDIYGLGVQLESWDEFAFAIKEADGSLSQLGSIPKQHWGFGA